MQHFFCLKTPQNQLKLDSPTRARFHFFHFFKSSLHVSSGMFCLSLYPLFSSCSLGFALIFYVDVTKTNSGLHMLAHTAVSTSGRSVDVSTVAGNTGSQTFTQTPGVLDRGPSHVILATAIGPLPSPKTITMTIVPVRSFCSFYSDLSDALLISLAIMDRIGIKMRSKVRSVPPHFAWSWGRPEHCHSTPRGVSN